MSLMFTPDFGTHKGSITVVGSLTADGKCSGGSYIDNGIEYTSVIVIHEYALVVERLE